MPEILATAGRLREDMTSANFEKDILSSKQKEYAGLLALYFKKQCDRNIYRKSFPEDDLQDPCCPTRRPKASSTPRNSGRELPEGVCHEVSNNAVTGGPDSYAEPGSSGIRLQQLSWRLVMQGISVGFTSVCN